MALLPAFSPSPTTNSEFRKFFCSQLGLLHLVDMLSIIGQPSTAPPSIHHSKLFFRLRFLLIKILWKRLITVNSCGVAIMSQTLQSRRCVAALLVLLVSFFTTSAFLCQPPGSVRRWTGSASSSSLEGTYDPYGGSSKEEKFNARTDLRQFLTQRSIQSFVFLLNQCKEGHTVRWLENQLDFKKIDSYHGTGAFNMTSFPEWDSFFLQLAMQSHETVVVEIEAQRKSHRGWKYQGNYLDGLNNDNGGASKKASGDSASNVPASSRRRGVTGNYLSQLNNSPEESLSASSASGDWPPKEPSSIPTPNVKPRWQPGTRSSGAAGNYLASLGGPSQPTSSEEDIPSIKSKQKDDIASKISPKTNGVKGGSYLDGLSSNTIESKQQDDAPSTPNSDSLVENPHLESKTLEYEFEVDPASLVTRIISVREQISKEWKDDLATLVRTNDRILDEYEEKQRVAEMQAMKEDEEEDDDEEDEVEKSTYRHLQDMATPYRASQEEGGKSVEYDRNAMVYLTNSISTQGQAASPFRRSNFDLLLLLCTQESVRRVLSEYKDDTEDEFRKEKYDLLNSFYKKHAKKYFDGHDYSFGRGDQFLEAFLKESPIARTTDSGSLALIDPVAIMEDLLRLRSTIAQEWKSIVDTIPDEHLNLRRILFDRHLMESSNWDSTAFGSGGIHLEEDASSVETVSEPGAFE